MFNLVYDCFKRGQFVKRVNTYDEAKEWLKESKEHTTKKVYAEITQERTEKDEIARAERIKKREAFFKAKRNAAVG